MYKRWRDLKRIKKDLLFSFIIKYGHVRVKKKRKNFSINLNEIQSLDCKNNIIFFIVYFFK